jgi:Fungal protein kinase
MRTWVQGTWPFMAAELILEPHIPHSFLHDLESTYYVLLFHGITNMKHNSPPGFSANILYDVLDSRRYDQRGGLQKFGFILGAFAITQYNAPSNNHPFTSLIHSLHLKLRERYLQLDDASANRLAAPRLPSFMTPAECKATNFGHDALIEIFDKELKSPDWPADDRATRQIILRSNSELALLGSGSKRSRAPEDDGGKSTGNRNNKRQYQSSAA